MQTNDSLEKSLMLRKIKGRRRRECWRLRWLDGITDAMNMNLGKLPRMVKDREAWSALVYGVTKSQTTTKSPKTLSKQNGVRLGYFQSGQKKKNYSEISKGSWFLHLRHSALLCMLYSYSSVSILQ